MLCSHQFSLVSMPFGKYAVSRPDALGKYAADKYDLFSLRKSTYTVNEVDSIPNYIKIRFSYSKQSLKYFSVNLEKILMCGDVGMC